MTKKDPTNILRLMKKRSPTGNHDILRLMKKRSPTGNHDILRLMKKSDASGSHDFLRDGRDAWIKVSCSKIVVLYNIDYINYVPFV